ncbi:hypothetical protein HanRHA438_Chr08g0360501 [Helianthus annuus]|nr:hypothetical protein HanRHA438_Chr08g0360501 [Helianthus annuus]
MWFSRPDMCWLGSNGKLPTSFRSSSYSFFSLPAFNDIPVVYSYLGLLTTMKWVAQFFYLYRRLKTMPPQRGVVSSDLGCPDLQSIC